jgi:opacity protein-like surface antigen
MNKFKNATKRIAAVATSAVMLSSAAFAADLGSYPRNFVSGDEFTGHIVVGADAASSDSAAASSIIDDLRSQFSGSTSQVMLTYGRAGDGEERNIARSNSQLNYGETIDDCW